MVRAFVVASYREVGVGTLLHAFVWSRAELCRGCMGLGSNWSLPFAVPVFVVAARVADAGKSIRPTTILSASASTTRKLLVRFRCMSSILISSQRSTVTVSLRRFHCLLSAEMDEKKRGGSSR